MRKNIDQHDDQVAKEDLHLLNMQNELNEDIYDVAANYVTLYESDAEEGIIEEYNNNEYMEANNTGKSLDNLLEELVEDKRNLSKFQIMDEIVERVSGILEQRGITEFDPNDIKDNVEKWVPRVSSKNETPPAFIKRVYGQVRGITMADIQHIDPPLYKANRNWISRNKKSKDYVIPWKPDLGITDTPTAYQGYNYRRVLAFKNKKYA